MAVDDITIIDIESYCLGLHEAEDRLDAMIAALDDMHGPLGEILDDFHHHTAQWMLSSGDGTYPPLEASTIRNKVASGSPFPGLPLFETGALFASAIGDGPFTLEGVGRMEAFEGLDWEKDGYNIAALHQTGVPERLVTQHRHHTDGTPYEVTFPWHLPSRPIFTITDALISLGADHIVDHVFQP